MRAAELKVITNERRKKLPISNTFTLVINNKKQQFSVQNIFVEMLDFI